MKDLYHRYCKENMRDKSESHSHGTQNEYTRQRDYLERTVASLTRKVNKDQVMHRTDNVRIIQENMSLVKCVY